MAGAYLSLNWPSKFSTDCTVPLERFTFVTSPNTRGTLDILYGSLFAIFICIWTIQHPNRGDIKWALKGSQKKVKWMLVTLLAPEVFLAKALADFWAAKRSVARVRTLRDKAGKLLPESKVANWTISHAYYAEMGGFALRTSTPRESGEGHKLQRLRSEDIFELRELGCISRLPSITKDQIMDKGKGDFIVKLTAILQVFWMLIQVIVRAARGLPISRLEVTACAFAACASVTYVLWWNKPQAVTACTKITIEARETWALAQFGTSWTFDKGRLPYKSIFEAFVPLSDSKAYTTEDMPISNDALPAETIATRGLSGSITLGLALGCMLLGAIHCAAWNFYLPTRTEQLLWRCFSLPVCNSSRFFTVQNSHGSGVLGPRARDRILL
ncbi:hypothetical protein DL98DRAFT_627796 [Cadophora sp. DSE1049]|nr:hypothetical protein DL98DRAFT_627796 [Cadophora sp. DSE1049]